MPRNEEAPSSPCLKAGAPGANVLVVTRGKKVGTYLGRVAIRASGSFNIQTGNGLVQGIHHRFCTLLQRADGYGYSWVKIASTQGDAGQALSLPGLKAGVSRANG
jgi:hypothetical protein